MSNNSDDTSKSTTSISLSNNENNEDSEADNQAPQIPYRRDRTPSIVVQSLGLSGGKSSYLTDSIELPGEEEDTSQNSSSSDAADRKSSASGLDDSRATGVCDGPDGSAKGSLSSISGSSTSQTTREQSGPPKQQTTSVNRASPKMGGSSRRLSLTITSTAPRRLSLTVEGMTGSLINQTGADSSASNYPSGSATGSLRNKVALKPGHSLMGWTKLASTAKDLSGTGGKLIEVTPEELAKHDSESDCWIALNGNVYNVTTYLNFHPGGVEELMRGAGKDATDLFIEVHRWVNYESILAKCLVGPYKLESPLTPSGRDNFVTMTASPSSNNDNSASEKSLNTNGQTNTNVSSDGRVVST